MDLGGTLGDSMERLVAFTPSLVAGLIVLLIGYVIGKVLERVLRPLLHRVGFDRLVHRVGFTDAKESDAGSARVGTLALVLVMLVAVMQAARIWELRLVSTGLARFFAYLPHVLGAVVIFAAALWFGNWVRSRMLRGAVDTTTAETSGGENRLAASAVRAAILTLGAFMALRELQVGAQIVTIGFTLALGSIAVAAALAFGLGSRDVAGRAMERWFDRGVGNRPPGGGLGTTRTPAAGAPI